jgi:hypothetical protein
MKHCELKMTPKYKKKNHLKSNGSGRDPIDTGTWTTEC